MAVHLIRFDFNEGKATAAAAVLLKKRSRRRMPYLRLMKLLYIAERESLRRRGCPIVGDYYVSMKHGPVLSSVLTLIKADARDLGKMDLWFRHIKTVGYDVELVEEPCVEVLSESELEILEKVFRRYRHLGRWAIRDLTHTFPEWRNPGESCLPIRPEQILRAVGKTDEEILEIAEEVETSSRVDALIRGEIPA